MRERSVWRWSLVCNGQLVHICARVRVGCWCARALEFSRCAWGAVFTGCRHVEKQIWKTLWCCCRKRQTWEEKIPNPSKSLLIQSYLGVRGSSTLQGAPAEVHHGVILRWKEWRERCVGMSGWGVAANSGSGLSLNRVLSCTGRLWSLAVLHECFTTDVGLVLIFLPQYPGAESWKIKPTLPSDTSGHICHALPPKYLSDSSYMKPVVPKWTWPFSVTGQDVAWLSSVLCSIAFAWLPPCILFCSRWRLTSYCESCISSYVLYLLDMDIFHHVRKERAKKKKCVVCTVVSLEAFLKASGSFFFHLSPSPISWFHLQEPCTSCDPKKFYLSRWISPKEHCMEHTWSFITRVARFLPAADSCMFQFLTSVIPQSHLSASLPWNCLICIWSHVSNVSISSNAANLRSTNRELMLFLPLCFIFYLS